MPVQGLTFKNRSGATVIGGTSCLGAGTRSVTWYLAHVTTDNAPPNSIFSRPDAGVAERPSTLFERDDLGICLPNQDVRDGGRLRLGHRRSR